MLANDRGNILKGPLPAFVSGVRATADEQQRTLRVLSAERAMAATTDVRSAPPVESFVAKGRRDHQITGMRRKHRRVEPAQGIRVNRSLDPVPSNRGLERLEVPPDDP